VRVHSSSGIDLSNPGDSGGPWFINYEALGTMSCENGLDAIYSPIDYVEQSGYMSIATS